MKNLWVKFVIMGFLAVSCGIFEAENFGSENPQSKSTSTEFSGEGTSGERATKSEILRYSDGKFFVDIDASGLKKVLDESYKLHLDGVMFVFSGNWELDDRGDLWAAEIVVEFEVEGESEESTETVRYRTCELRPGLEPFSATLHAGDGKLQVRFDEDLDHTRKAEIDETVRLGTKGYTADQVLGPRDCFKHIYADQNSDYPMDIGDSGTVSFPESLPYGAKVYPYLDTIAVPVLNIYVDEKRVRKATLSGGALKYFLSKIDQKLADHIPATPDKEGFKAAMEALVLEASKEAL